MKTNGFFGLFCWGCSPGIREIHGHRSGGFFLLCYLGETFDWKIRKLIMSMLMGGPAKEPGAGSGLNLSEKVMCQGSNALHVIQD